MKLISILSLFLVAVCTAKEGTREYLTRGEVQSPMVQDFGIDIPITIWGYGSEVKATADGAIGYQFPAYMYTSADKSVKQLTLDLHGYASGSALAQLSIFTPILTVMIPGQLNGARADIIASFTYDMIGFENVCVSVSYQLTGSYATASVNADVYECRYGFVRQFLGEGDVCEWTLYRPPAALQQDLFRSWDIAETQLVAPICTSVFNLLSMI